MNGDEPTFVTTPFPKDDVYDSWLNHIDKIEQFTKLYQRPADTLDIIYMLFPLIDTVSYTLFGSSGRRYLKELGIEKPDLVYKIFRNGHLHNAGNYKLVYDDGEVGWGMTSGGGSGGILPYDPGYVSEEFPEDNMPAESVFEYVQFKSGEVHASLSLERLAALIRYDLRQRKKSDTRSHIDVIVGQKIKGKRPSARRVE